MVSNFVCAGFETLSGIADRFIKSKNYSDQFTREDVNRFFSNTCNKFLHSFGQNFRGKKNYKNYKESEAKLFSKCRSTGLFNESTFFTDSGGFQASIGLLNRNEFSLLYKLYYEFLQEYPDVYDRAFILDPVPGPGCQLFDNFDDVYRMNLESYTTALNMPEKVRDKIIYIHHFRTPKLWDIFTKILHDYDMFSHFKHFATGGIVANQGSDTKIPCIIYTLPLVPLLREAKNHKFSKLDFHILGGATYRDILFYELFRIHVLEEHGVELNITYDSSGLFKGLMQARMVNILEGSVIEKLDIKTLSQNIGEDQCHGEVNYSKKGSNLNVGVSNLCKFKNCLQNMAERHGFKIIPVDNLYSEETGTFPEDIRIYSLFYMLDFYARVQDLLRSEAERIYVYFRNGDIRRFSTELWEVTKNINSGKSTGKQGAKTNSVVRSLNMLTGLDVDYAQYLVETFLGKDEFVDLSEDTTVDWED